MKTTGRVVCFGEMLVRMSVPVGERYLQSAMFAAHLGGAEANVAVSLSRLGTSSSMVTVLPENPFGSAARDELRRHGVDISELRFSDRGRMGLYFLTPGAVLRAPEVMYDRAHTAFSLADPALIDWEQALEGASWLHISGITPAVSANAAKATLKAVRVARSLGVKVSFDGNYRARLWGAWGGNGAETLRAIATGATLALIDERDIALILGKSFDEKDPLANRDAAVSAAFEAFPALTLIASTIRSTHAVDSFELGATLYTRAGRIDAAPMKLHGVLDRIGSGDAFAAGLLHALTSDNPQAYALQFALAAAAAKHGQVGDMSFASADDIRALLDQSGLDVKR